MVWVIASSKEQMAKLRSIRGELPELRAPSPSTPTPPATTPPLGGVRSKRGRSAMGRLADEPTARGDGQVGRPRRR
ncbi:MAG: hypothetical protein U0797_26620 [Gemmataceae bacterium]